MKNNSRNIIWVITMLVLVLAFVALAISLTNIVPGNPLREYSLHLAILFIVLTVLERTTYKKRNNGDN